MATTVRRARGLAPIVKDFMRQSRRFYILFTGTSPVFTNFLDPFG
jgi:hypothetical protein